MFWVASDIWYWQIQLDPLVTELTVNTNWAGDNSASPLALFPEELYEVDHLHVLHYTGNGLCKFDPSPVVWMNNLVALDLSNNNISVFNVPLETVCHSLMTT